jgi:hypothetical protein
LYDDFIRAIAIDPVTREVWLADWNFNRVRKYSPTGAPIFAFVASQPTGLAVRDGLVYVAEQGLDRIQVRTTAGVLVRAFGSSGSGPGQLDLSETSGLALAPDGSLLVADSENDRIQQFAADGSFVAALSPGRGTQPGKFIWPSGIAFSPAGHVLYVLDTINDRVQIYCLVTPSLCLGELHSDGDGIADIADNCPFVTNPGQENAGGVATPDDPAGNAPDAIGDACQCGRVASTGIVDQDDREAMRQHLAGSPAPFPTERCSVSGGEGCDVLDLVTLVRAASGKAPGVKQLCSAALRVLP